ncbi:hypothetical protein [Geobacter argillaceus]|uniref:Uncharacterized protein n=1 Tax=Geobacter argillaceus TaxID=345631 RepID=A0A562WQ93_9BACT|nr:hypothetical protein [Geobacter argillaceus]TWJ32405.1 hypothetical protein JN12_00845 [Geobacter argillaceus]
MKTTTPGNTMAMLIGSASTAFAATGAREDNSGLFVWIFLGFCALIIVAQLVPAIMVALGFAKAFGKQKEEVPQPVNK